VRLAVAISERIKRFNIYKFVLSIPGILLVYSITFLIYFLLHNSPNGNNPVFFQLGNSGPTFRWYGIIITVGVILAAFITQYLAERRGENPERTWVLLPVVLVSGILGARFWYVANTWAKYKDHLFTIGDPSAAGVFEIWRGGIAIQGAVVGGAIGVAIYKWLVGGINFLRWADFIAPGLILAQACGRWGNFMNNEAYGRSTGLPWGLTIPCEYRTTGTTPGTVDTSCAILAPDQKFHPTFLYESVWDYTVFLTLLFAITRPKTVERWTKVRLRDGDIFFFYMILYSIGRFMIENLRTDPLYLIGDPVNGGIRSAQAISIIFIFVGAVALFARHRQRTPDSEALSVRVRPALTKRQLREQQANTSETEVENEATISETETELGNESAENTEVEAEAEIAESAKVKQESKET
jgi:phosphatidylglycerol:prolipoprotein diacylglycerol transferase